MVRTGSRTVTVSRPPQSQEKAHLRKVNAYVSVQVPVGAENMLPVVD